MVLRSKEASAKDVIQTVLASQKEVFTLNDYYMQTVNKIKEDVQALKAHYQLKRSGFHLDKPSLSSETAAIASPVSKYLSHAMPVTVSLLARNDSLRVVRVSQVNAWHL